MHKNYAFQQAPLRNESVVGAHVYSHSGEFSPQVFDLNLSSRGLSFQFLRKYRSGQSDHIGIMGRGWTFTFNQQLEQSGADVLYHDGFGRVHKFEYSTSGGNFLSPRGLYSVLSENMDHYLIEQRLGNRLIFEPPVSGGRLLAIIDKNGNSVKFAYSESQILVTDPFGRHIEITLDHERVVALSDHAHRTWNYNYNQNACLIEVIQPFVHGSSDCPRVRYTYDEFYRLVSITDPKGQTFLENFFDEQGRIKEQKHGKGTIVFEYESVDGSTSNSAGFQTKIKLKNGGLLSLKHDAAGHVVERILFVKASSISLEDRNGAHEGKLPLLTTSRYNLHGELELRTYPAGNSTEWVYDHDNIDPRAQGNLLQVSNYPIPEEESQLLPLVTRYSYEKRYQQVASVTDARGNTTMFDYDKQGNPMKKSFPSLTVQEISNDINNRNVRNKQLFEQFEHNEAGQLIRFIGTNGATTEYFYYPASDPAGLETPYNGSSLVQKSAGGFLAKIVRATLMEERQFKDPSVTLVTGFSYDNIGNVTAIYDGKNNPVQFEYDLLNHLVGITSRQPHSYVTSLRYDSNGNMIERILTFNHHEYDASKLELVPQTTTLHHCFEYNELNNVIKRSVKTANNEVSYIFMRDATENIVREIQPMGNEIEYRYNEQNQIIKKRLASGTSEEVNIIYTYTLNGKLSVIIDGLGNKKINHYDTFNRYEGFTNAIGTRKKLWRDEAGNVSKVEVYGNSMKENSESDVEKDQLLRETWFQYDELNRLVRMDRAWKDSTGESLGESRWDRRQGVVSRLVQYDDNHLPCRVWLESGNVLQFQYDGVNRLNAVRDETGESVTIEYDVNSNPKRIERKGPPVEDGEQFHQIINQRFDEMDRLIARSVNDNDPETFSYNARSSLMEYQCPGGGPVHILYDTFGRLSGRKSEAIIRDSVSNKVTSQTILQRVEWDDNNRIISTINANGHATNFYYNSHNQRKEIVFADGATCQIIRDANGNVKRVIEPNGTVINNDFDAIGRLIVRRIDSVHQVRLPVLELQYDGLNRLIFANANGVKTKCSYDSLSLLLEETQSDFKIHYRYDSAGNRIYAGYPGGLEIYKTFDQLGRVLEVRMNENTIAKYTYGVCTQYKELKLGNELKATFSYESGKDWLSSIIYQSVKNGEILDEKHYLYDLTGKPLHEVQVRKGKNFGERYFYDSANRLIKVQYGVKTLTDPESPFEWEVDYELDELGLWRRKIAYNASGQIIQRSEGKVNQRERYLSLGNRSFDYDANGNCIREADEEKHLKIYTYDYANRLVRVEKLNDKHQVLQTIEYEYDAFGRQVLKRMGKENKIQEFKRVWIGNQLIEEWENSRIAKSFIYGNRANEPIQMINHADQHHVYYYASDGYGSVTALFNQDGRLTEAYQYDVHGQPLFSNEDDNDRYDANTSSRIGNPHLLGSFIYDTDTGLYSCMGNSYDPESSQYLNEKIPGPWADGYVLPEEVDTGGMSGPGGVSMPGKDPWTGGYSDYDQWIIDNSEYGWLGSAAGWIVDQLPSYIFGKGLGKLGVKDPFSFVMPWGISWVIGLEDDVGGRSRQPGYGIDDSNTNSGSSSSNNSGTSSSQPEDRPFGGGVDYGNSGGGSSGNHGTSGSNVNSGNSNANTNGEEKKEHKPVLNNNGEWVYEDTGEPVKPEDKKDSGTSGNMPNPEDGTGEGIDKDWWRDLPFADPLEALRSHKRVDERHGTPLLTLGALDGFNHLIGFLTPQPVSVDERGGGITINLENVSGDWSSTWESSSDGWGDKPRTMAEALAAPRIRTSSIMSRF